MATNVVYIDTTQPFELHIRTSPTDVTIATGCIITSWNTELSRPATLLGAGFGNLMPFAGPSHCSMKLSMAAQSIAKTVQSTLTSPQVIPKTR